MISQTNNRPVRIRLNLNCLKNSYIYHRKMKTGLKFSIWVNGVNLEILISWSKKGKGFILMFINFFTAGDKIALKIVGGPSSVDLARGIARSLNLAITRTTTKRFPDGEFYFKFEEDISGEDVLIVQSLYPSQDAHSMELFFILQTTKDLGAKSITIFIPYLAYSRQDRRYLQGECLSSATIAKTLEFLGADAIYTVDIHNEKVLKMYNIQIHNLTAAAELAKYFATKKLTSPIVVAPDAEELASRRARFAAQSIDADYDYLEKERNRRTGEITTYEKHLDVNNRDAIIIDDIISTGKTAANAANILKKQGARRVFVGVTHALMLGDSARLFSEVGVDEVVGTDTVANEYGRVSVAPILARAIGTITPQF